MEIVGDGHQLHRSLADLRLRLGPSLSTSFGAQATETTYVFASVTGIQYAAGDGPAAITGVLVNDTTSTTLVLPGFSDRCSNFLLTMTSNSGTYKLTIVTDTEPYPMGGGTSTGFSRCRLDLAP